MTQAYFKGAHENPGFACAAKHFPGDGLDERDQHLSPSINSADCDTWMNTYGKVYQGLIDQGLEAIMAGHIMQSAWTRALNPGIKDEDIMPATLSPELLQGLLRGKLGFNGLILIRRLSHGGTHLHAEAPGPASCRHCRRVRHVSLLQRPG